MTLHTDILIIGGGISGLLVAREMHLAGRNVTIIDQSSLGSESSWAGGGILLPIYPWRQAEAISDLVLISLAMYPQLSHELLTETGIDPEWHPCGMLICKNPDIESATNWCQTRQVRHLTPPASLLKDLNSTLEQPLWLPDIAQARNPRLLKSLIAFLKQHGVRFVEQGQINAVELDQHQIRRLRIGEQDYSAEQVVLCTGAWTGDFLLRWLPQSAIRLKIQPVRGQMLLFDAKPDTLTHMVLDGDHYLIPRRDGKILAGSTVEQVGFEKLTTLEARQQLYSFATELLPSLKQYPVCAHWAGLRPGTPDGVPYIGYHPDIDNLAINAGHFRNGLVMGPASARLLADLILGRTPCTDPAAYALDRAH